MTTRRTPSAATAPATTADADAPPGRLFTRITAGGIERRVDTGGEQGFDVGMPVADDAPLSCTVVDQAVATAISDEEVVQAWLPVTRGAGARSGTGPAQRHDGPRHGRRRDRRRRRSLPDDVVRARLMTAGAVDEMQPVHGIAALAVRTTAGDPVTGRTPRSPVPSDRPRRST